MWNPIEAFKRKLKGGAVPEPKSPAAAALKEAVRAGLPPGEASPLDVLEKKGLLGKFYRHWKDPAMLQQVRALVARMQVDGINVKDASAVQSWIKDHQDAIESGRLADAPGAAKPRTFVKTAPEVGRNDPCPCGSRKKYKKCCEGTKT